MKRNIQVAVSGLFLAWSCTGSAQEPGAEVPTPMIHGTSSVDLDDDSVQPPAPDGKHTLRGQFKEDPIVFVHGCPLPRELGGSVTNARTASLWWKMHEYFVGQGYPDQPWLPDGSGGYETNMPRRAAPGQYLNVFVADGPNCGANQAHAEGLRRFIDEVRQATGSARVDLVANSLGAIPARLVIQASGGKRIRDVVILAGANHGTDMALATRQGDPYVSDPQVGNPIFASPHYDGARELFPAYACAGESPNDLQFQLNGCLNPRHTGGVMRNDAKDETPFDAAAGGALAYLNIYNAAFDELIEPTSSACLNQQFLGDCSDPVNDAVQIVVSGENGRPDAHGGIRFDAGVIEKTHRFVRQRNKVQR